MGSRRAAAADRSAARSVDTRARHAAMSSRSAPMMVSSAWASPVRVDVEMEKGTEMAASPLVRETPVGVSATYPPAVALGHEAPNLAPHPIFDVDTDGDGVPDGWYVDAPRPALRPVFGLDGRVRRSGRWAATARGSGNPHCFGKWGQLVPVLPGRYYRIS